jgi:protein phosphatase
LLRTAETTQKTDTGMQRSSNEDAAYARAPVFVVADGMGGARAGEVASQIAVEVFQRGLPEEGSAEQRLAAAAREANRRIHELSHESNERAGMGTTLTAVYLDGDALAIAHVGDSRAYLFRDGALKRLTQDHTLVNALVMQGKLTEDQAAEHPQRSIITRALGPEADVEVDTWSYPLRGEDVVLLCSDGLTGMISEDRIAAILGDRAGLDAAAERMIADANAAGGRDNITVVAFRVEDVGSREDTDQPTLVGMTPAPPVGPEDGVGHDPGPAAEARADQPGGALATAERMASPQPAPPPGPIQHARRARLARTQGRPQRVQDKRHLPRSVKALAALIAAAIVLFLLGAAGWLASRQLYFLGTNAQGVVTIYRGLPYTLPGGMRLYESFYVSGVPASMIPADRRASLLGNQLRSESDAANLVRDLELGKVLK